MALSAVAIAVPVALKSPVNLTDGPLLVGTTITETVASGPSIT